jgi:hypothetical protein
MVIKRVSLALAAVLLLGGCASSGEGAPRGQYDVITAEEIEAANVSNLYELVERLRPRWLDVRARQSFSVNTAIVVYQGQSLLGGVDMLRQLGKDAAVRLRYLDGPTASATLPGLGTRQVEAAIVLNPVR